MHTPKVYIVILNYLQWQDTRDCLESVLKSPYTDFSVIIIDNDSRNHSIEHLLDWATNAGIKAISSTTDSLPGTTKAWRVFSPATLKEPVDFSELPLLTFIQSGINGGFAAGNNIALRLLADLDAYVWLLNPDMIVEENTLAELVSFQATRPPGCIIGAQVRSYTGNQELLFYGGGSINFRSGTVQLIRSPKAMDRLDYISGGCLFTHASGFKKMGLLPEDYFLYWEETDWCYRAKQQGVSLFICPSAICYDKISTVIGKGYVANYYYCRNGLLFISRYRKKNIPIVLLSVVIRWFKRIITGQWGRARGVYKGTIDFLKKKFNEAQ